MNRKEAEKIVFLKMKGMFSLIQSVDYVTEIKEPLSNWKFIDIIEDAKFRIKVWSNSHNSKFASFEKKGIDVPLYIFKIK